MNIDTQALGEMLTQGVITYGTKIVIAIVILIIGLFIIRRIVRAVEKIFERTKLDEALERFLASLTSVALKILLIIMVISTLGVETTSFVAILGAAGLAIGLALQGSLANFAGGALILFFKPFSIGDMIEAGGHRGVVNDIQIFNTVIIGPNKERIIIPNGELSNNPMVNITGAAEMGVEFTFGIGYGDDIDQAKGIIKNILDQDQRIATGKGYKLGVRTLGASSVDIFVRAIVSPKDYWNVLFDTTENVKKAFDANNISIPFPQMDVHLDKN